MANKIYDIFLESQVRNEDFFTNDQGSILMRDCSSLEDAMGATRGSVEMCATFIALLTHT